MKGFGLRSNRNGNDDATTSPTSHSDTSRADGEAVTVSTLSPKEKTVASLWCLFLVSVSSMAFLSNLITTTMNTQRTAVTAAAAAAHPVLNSGSEEESIGETSSSRRARILASRSKGPSATATSFCPVRHCQVKINDTSSSYPNLIVAPKHPAGLGDRLDMLQALGDLAALTCARLVVPPPHQWLAVKHNGRASLPATVHWGDLVEFPFVPSHDDDKDGVKSHHSNNNNNNNNNASLSTTHTGSPLLLVEPFERHQLPGYAYRRFRKTQLLDMLNIMSRQHKSKSTPTANSSPTNSTQRQQQPAFIWFMKHKYFWAVAQVVKKQLNELRNETKSNPEVRDYLHMLPRFFDNGPGCGHYLRQRHPRVLHEMAKKVLEQAMFMTSRRTEMTTTNLRANKTKNVSDHSIALPSTRAKISEIPFGFLHLRRTDGIKECDANIPKLTSFLNCSFSGPHAQSFLFSDDDDNSTMAATVTGKKDLTRAIRPNFLMFMASDSADPEYRKTVLQLLEQQGRAPLSFNQNQEPTLSRVHAIDVDALIQNVLAQEISANRLPARFQNNFVVFLIGRMLMKKAVLYIRQRRFICPACSREVVEPAFAKLLSLGHDGRQHDDDNHDSTTTDNDASYSSLADPYLSRVKGLTYQTY